MNSYLLDDWKKLPISLSTQIPKFTIGSKQAANHEEEENYDNHLNYKFKQEYKEKNIKTRKQPREHMCLKWRSESSCRAANGGVSVQLKAFTIII